MLNFKIQGGQIPLCSPYPMPIMMSQKRRLQINSCFWIFMLRLFVSWVSRYAAQTESRFGHPCYRRMSAKD